MIMRLIYNLLLLLFIKRLNETLFFLSFFVISCVNEKIENYQYYNMLNLFTKKLYYIGVIMIVV